jgi:tetratricopeptide (TPR) repeat protein
MKNKILTFIIILSTIYCLRSIISFYFADIAFNRGDLYTAIHLNPTEPIYYSRLGLLLSQNNDPEAIKYSNKAVSISPANLNILKERAQTFFYLSNLDNKYYFQSLATLETITKLAPSDPKIPWLYGQFLEAAGKKEEAIPFYETAVKLKDNYDDAHFALAQIFYAQKDYKKARIYLEKPLSIAPSNSEAQALLFSLPLSDKPSPKIP